MPKNRLPNRKYKTKFVETNSKHSMKFKDLHDQDALLIICNVWDVTSSKAAQALNFKAIGTSSGAIAAMLGYRDGEEMTFKEMAYIVERIARSTAIPLTVDLEGGYSRNSTTIVEHMKQLEQLGVVGVNIEDSIVNGNRTILDADAFAKTLEEICSSLIRQNLKLFVNVRTDPFLLKLPNALDQTIERAKKYGNAGAQGLFVPCIEKEQDIKMLVEHIDLPLNVMCMPKLPDFSTLKKIGVKRISMGNFVHHKSVELMNRHLKMILENQSFQNLFA